MASRATRLRYRPGTDAFRRIRLCPTQKVGYETRPDALDASEQAMALDKVDPGCHLTPYACDECGRWHLANRVIVPMRPR